MIPFTLSSPTFVELSFICLEQVYILVIIACFQGIILTFYFKTCKLYLFHWLQLEIDMIKEKKCHDFFFWVQLFFSIHVWDLILKINFVLCFLCREVNGYTYTSQKICQGNGIASCRVCNI